MDKSSDQLLEDYLLQKLPEAARKSFESRLAIDPELRRELENQKQIMDGIRASKRNLARNQARDLRQKIKSNNGGKPAWFSLLLFVGVVGLLWLGYRVFFSGPREATNSTPNQPIFPENEKPIQESEHRLDQAQNQLQEPDKNEDKRNPETQNLTQYIALADQEASRFSGADFPSARQRSGVEEKPNNPRQSGNVAFDKKAFAEAAIYFEQVTDLQEYPDDFSRLGFCYLKMGKTGKAIGVFQKMADPDFDPEWESRANWYLALAFLQAGPTRKLDFEQLMDRITKNENIDKSIRQRLIELKKRVD